jgi:hypothetical protein
MRCRESGQSRRESSYSNLSRCSSRCLRSGEPRCSSYFLWDAYRLSYGIAAHDERPGAQTIGPSLCDSTPRIVGRSVRGAALRNEGLLHKSTTFVPADFSVEDMPAIYTGSLTLCR